DKRTALDVVANRLDHVGLGSLCALIHDPQRDQRDLYRSVREQLENLAGAETNPRSERDIAKIDSELQRLYSELASAWNALMQPDQELHLSFHELAGRWLSLADEDPLAVEAHADLRLGEFEQHRQELKTACAYAGDVDWTANPWTIAAGLSLTDFAARPQSALRQSLAAAADAARNADATLDERIPPLDGSVDLAGQSEARVAFGKRLRTALAQVPIEIRTRWAHARPAELHNALRTLAHHADQAGAVEREPLDVELGAALRESRPMLTAVRAELGELEAYLASARHWYGWLMFGRRSKAFALVKRYGLPPTQASAQRLRDALAGYLKRRTLQTVLDEFVADAAQDGALLKDVILQQHWQGHREILELRTAAIDDPRLAPLAERVTAALADPVAGEALLAGIELTPARVESLLQLRNALAAAGLFDAGWIADRMTQWANAADELARLVARFETLEGVLRARRELEQVSPVLQQAARDVLHSGRVGDAALAAIERLVLSAEISRRLQASSELQLVDERRWNEGFARFGELESQKRQAARDLILHRWTDRQQARLVVGTGSRLNSQGADLRRRLTLRGERAMRLRQVIAAGSTIEGGDPLFDLRPLWMASPETVAQIFPREPLFDVVVFDEASQCRLEEALPVLTRGKRVVIAGDPKQLPPTRFFESSISASDDDEDLETEQDFFEAHQSDVEDLLAAALGIEIDQAFLDVHYRSRSADLVEFSNEHFYDSRLQAIPGHPSRRLQFPPITLYRADGVYTERTNEAEAEQVCRIVHDLLRRAEPPSIGIASFNLAQRDLIVEKLEEWAGRDAEFAAKLAEARIRRGDASFEGLFVKNLENVQGDERDHIIISTTYGPDPQGRFYRRFGPIGRAGGGRRLNVLVTRARNEVHLVTSIPRSAYLALPPVPAGQAPNGAWLLFSYLQYAEQLEQLYGQAQPTETEEDTLIPEGEWQAWPTSRPSPFVEGLAARLQAVGLKGASYWGNNGFCVDVELDGARPEDRGIVGILCDGVRFAPTGEPIEWDLFRTAILRDHGWQLRRLLSPRFFRDPEAILRQLQEATAPK
ncbi:MAG TPA: AAA domain-containing protein, partial [Planctomycetaceae bacterium]|nr:AAA domain-containing protein [Planctomycetaceae bacterium]